MSLLSNLVPATSGLSSIGTTAEGLAFGAVSSAVADYFNIIPQGMLGTIAIQATLEENLEHDLELTDHPVQSGASITDHSYLLPREITLKCGWSNSNSSSVLTTLASFTTGALSSSDYVSGIYSQLLQLQQSRTPFSVVGTLLTYPNMLMTSLSITRDKDSSNALICNITCREVIIVDTVLVGVSSASTLLSPVDNQPTDTIGAVAPLLATPAPGGSLPLSPMAEDNNTYGQFPTTPGYGY